MQSPLDVPQRSGRPEGDEHVPGLEQGVGPGVEDAGVAPFERHDDDPEAPPDVGAGQRLAGELAGRVDHDLGQLEILRGPFARR